MQSRDDGSPRAPIVIIGEAYGATEMQMDRPFVGPSWHDKLRPWLAAVGLGREDCFITNAWDQGQPQNINAIGEQDWRGAWDRLYAKLAAHEGPDGAGPRVIVPLGNNALYALTGKGRVSFHARDGRWERPGITDWRGSILSHLDTRGRTHKVIPSIHPASTFRTPQYSMVCAMDWARIAVDAQFRELRLPQRTHLIAPSESEVVEWVRWTRDEAARRKDRPADGTLDGRLIASLDVETPKRTEYEVRQKESTAANGKCATCGHTRRWHEHLTPAPLNPDGPDADTSLGVCTKKAQKKLGGRLCTCGAFQALMGKPRRVAISSDAYLGCIGYSWDPAVSLTVPTTEQYWRDPAVWQRVQAALVALHADTNILKVKQNGSFDSYWELSEGLPVVGYAYDLLNMHRIQRPAWGWHDLAHQASLDTRQPFWKHEAKDPDSVAKYAHNNDALWTYNGIDNCVQRELLSRRIEALSAGGRLDYYLAIDAPMNEPLAGLSQVGFRVDVAGMRKERARVQTEAATVADAIEAAAEVRLVAKTAVSTAKMKVWLYETLRLPVQYAKNAKKQKVVSTDIVAIKRLMDRFPGHDVLQRVGKLVLQHRRLLKIAGILNAEKLDEDGRWRAQFKQDTLLGRLSSSETPRGTGANLQNIDRKLRAYFIGDLDVEDAA